MPSDKIRGGKASLFTPRQILFFSLLTGYPTGLVLCSFNWIRMGLTGTAVVHWIAGALLLTIWSFTLRATSCGTWLGAAIHIGFCAYLSRQMGQAISRFKLEGNEVYPAAWKSGCLTAIVTLLILFVSSALLLLLLTSGK